MLYSYLEQQRLFADYFRAKYLVIHSVMSDRYLITFFRDTV